MNKKLAFIFAALLFAWSAEAQNSKETKMAAILTSQPKWVVYQVNSRRPDLEVGEVLKFRIDGKFYFDQNNYAKRGGEWILANKELVLIFDSFTEERRKIPTNYQIKNLENGSLILKYRNKNRKNEKVFLK